MGTGRGATMGQRRGGEGGVAVAVFSFVLRREGGGAEHDKSGGNFGAFCLDVRTSTFCQLMGFPLNH